MLILIVPKGIRTPVIAVKGQCPRPLDDGDRCGAKRDRTADLLHAMQALSQLSYSPAQRLNILGNPHWEVNTYFLVAVGVLVVVGATSLTKIAGAFDILVNIGKNFTMKQQSAISPTRKDDYPQWYQQVIKAADLAENSPVRGCMIIKPWGYALWEKMQAVLDAKFKATGHTNVYFPLLIPLEYLQKEAEHIQGFAKECAVVTHHRLEADADGKLVPAGELEDPYIIRPTSETVFGIQYAKWIKSYRDLPVKLNQWANVMRWEMRTRMFLRTSEFLWQEGHTAHATAAEAQTETRQMLDIYADFLENTLAIPVIPGEKTARERFPGAVNTFTVEAMMQDCKALQAGTSHFLGQNFAKSFQIQYTDQHEQLQHVWTTSWGFSTRMIGGLIMTHSDDNGLVLPPKIAPVQVVILPIVRKPQDAEMVMDYCEKLKTEIQQQTYHQEAIRVEVDARDINGGEKFWHYVKRGVPIRIEVGPRDIAGDSLFISRRDQVTNKFSLPRQQFVHELPQILAEMQQSLYDHALNYQKMHSHEFTNLNEFKDFFAGDNPGGFAYVFSSEDESIEPVLKEYKISARCIPLATMEERGVCIFTGNPGAQKIIYAKAY
jgi:prolyl-tRNA synthetase